MNCHNPECGKEFEPWREGTIYCSIKCRNRMTKILEKARRHAKSLESTHPCKRCGAPVGYKKVYCEACKVAPYKSGPGILPLNTRQIRASRAREQALIDKVVAKAQAGDSNTMTYRQPRRVLGGVKVG